MGRTGIRRDNGQARRLHNMQRAQLRLDGMLEDEFEVGIPRPLTSIEDGSIRIRFGARSLADYLSDSTVASAVVDDSSGEVHAPTEYTPVTSSFGDKLVSLIADADVSVCESRATGAIPIDEAEAHPHWLPPVFDDEDDGEKSKTTDRFSEGISTDRFSFRGFAGGFLIGAAVTAAALLLLAVLR